jgi:hypothetical protein
MVAKMAFVLDRRAVVRHQGLLRLLRLQHQRKLQRQRQRQHRLDVLILMEAKIIMFKEKPA